MCGHPGKFMKSTRSGRRRLGARGVSLIETMVALGLFAIGAASIGRFITRQTRTASTNNLTSVAQSFAEQELENMRALDYDDIAAASHSSTKGSVVYTIASTVQNNSPAPNMKQISVDVSWKDPLGTQHVTVYTIYTAITK
jgi:prepilin-type N-terminal cleavage/methylation domain-containing protein